MRVESLASVLTTSTRGGPEEEIPHSVGCRIAQQSYQDARSDLRRYQTLVFVAACAVVGFLLAAVVLLALGSDTLAGAVVAFVGTAFSGAGWRFVRGERDQARKDQAAAEQLVHRFCDGADDVMRRLAREEPALTG